MLGIALGLLRKKIRDGAKAQARLLVPQELQLWSESRHRGYCCALQAVTHETGIAADAFRAAELLEIGGGFGAASAIEGGFEGVPFDETYAPHVYYYALGRSLRPGGC